MLKRYWHLFTAVFFIFISIAVTATDTQAINHPLSGLTSDSSGNLDTLDLTMSVDWDVNAPPQKAISKSELNQVIDSFAKSLFAMTEGRHRLGKIYVFDNSKNNNFTDLKIISKKAGRAGASPACWTKGVGDIDIFLWESDSERDDYLGPTMAHECGHYIYGIFDEYREEGGKTAKKLDDPSDPASDDYNDHTSIMNRHYEYPYQFTTPADYSTAEKRKTAQYRVYESSIWETLVRNPQNDPTQGRKYGRIRYPAMVDFPVPANPTMPTANYNAALNIIFVKDAAVNSIMIDPAMNANDYTAAKNAAASLVQKLPLNSVVLIPVGVAQPIAATTISNETARTDLIKKIRTLTAAKITNFDAALSTVRDRTSAARSGDQTATVILFTTENEDVNDQQSKSFRNAKIGFNAIINSSTEPLATPEDGSSLASLCRDTGGTFTLAKSDVELSARARKIGADAEGDNDILIAQRFSEPLQNGETISLEFRIGEHDAEGNGYFDVSVFVDPADINEVTVKLTDPAGNELLTETAKAGFEVEKLNDEGLIFFKITPTTYGEATGVWTATVTAGSALSDSVGIAAMGTSTLQLIVDAVHPEEEYAPILRASLSTELPVLRAYLTADLYDPDGNLLIDDVMLYDDGTHGDLKENDGIYCRSLNEVIVSGEFFIEVTASNPDGTAVASNRNVYFAASSGNTEYAMGSFQRADDASAQLSPASARGCVMGGNGNEDYSLILLMIVALGLRFLSTKRVL
ncbi:hypothetical protein [Maridesulfovibrio sp.]|uniref:hypothetical protein n=1 Tax=unclassified Maridesulfovibrio TaxID=2794999 RepID=UPI003B00EBBB